MNDLHLNVFGAHLRLVLLFILTAVVALRECSADKFCGRRDVTTAKPRLGLSSTSLVFTRWFDRRRAEPQLRRSDGLVPPFSTLGLREGRRLKFCSSRSQCGFSWAQGGSLCSRAPVDFLTVIANLNKNLQYVSKFLSYVFISTRISNTFYSFQD